MCIRDRHYRVSNNRLKQTSHTVFGQIQQSLHPPSVQLCHTQIFVYGIAHSWHLYTNSLCCLAHFYSTVCQNHFVEIFDLFSGVVTLIGPTRGLSAVFVRPTLNTATQHSLCIRPKTFHPTLKKLTILQCNYF